MRILIASSIAIALYGCKSTAEKDAAQTVANNSLNKKNETPDQTKVLIQNLGGLKPEECQKLIMESFEATFKDPSGLENAGKTEAEQALKMTEEERKKKYGPIAETKCKEFIEKKNQSGNEQGGGDNDKKDKSGDSTNSNAKGSKKDKQQHQQA